MLLTLFPVDPLLRLLEPSKETTNIHDDNEEVFNKESKPIWWSLKESTATSPTKGWRQPYQGVYDDNTANGGDNIILEKEYSLDKDIPDGID